MENSMEEAAETVVHSCLDVMPDEHVLIVTDDGCYKIGDALYDAAGSIADDVSMLVMSKTGGHGREPSPVVASAMKAADVVAAPTSYSLSHTKARIKACKQGTRVATLPGVTEEIFTTSLLADYERIKDVSEALYDHLVGTERVHVTTPSGTDLSFEVDIDRWHTDTGSISDSGDFGNLPAGECDGAPVNATGEIVIDSLIIGGEKLCPSGTHVRIKHNEAVAISEDCELARTFEDTENARNIAELGIGTNPKATIIGNILQDEKVMGTCHVAFGDNTSYGGTVSSPIHWDAVLKQPTIRFDDTVIMRDGVFEVTV